MSHDLYFSVIMYIVGGFVFVGINAFVVGRFASGLATKEELKEKVKDRDLKIKEQGEWINRDFVRKDMCGQAHHFMDKEALRREEEAKSFRNEIKDSIQQLHKQFEEFRKEVFERIPKKE